MEELDKRDGERVEAGGVLRRLGELIVKNRVLLVVLACLFVFLILLMRVLGGEIMRIDTAAYALIVERLRADWLTPIMESFSALASPVVLIAMLFMIAAFAPGRRPGWCCALNLVLVSLLNVGIKALVQRPRPEGVPARRRDRLQLPLRSFHGGHGVFRAGGMARLALRARPA